jgi:hypothetical protein
MAPKTVRMLLVEGENADGGTVEEDNFDLACDDAAPTMSASDRVITAILGTREGATEAGYALASTGVTWTDPVEAAALREALATRKIANVMLVSAFLAAAALAQAVGSTTGNAHTALLFLEPDTATLAIVDTADGSISDVHKELISSADTVAELAEMVAGLDTLEPRPEGVFVVGSGVDITAVKAQLETLTSLPVSAPDEPDTALAWGAALASANAPMFASSTAALAYAQDPGTGAIDPYAVAPGSLVVHDVPPGTELGEEDLAYSAVPDEEAEANTAILDLAGNEHADGSSERRPLLLVGTVLAVVFVAAALALEVSLALGIRPSGVSLLPRPLQNLFVPTQQAPAPAPAPASAPVPQVNHLQAPVISPPVNAPISAPRPAAPPPAPVPAAPPAPVVAHPAPVPVPVPLAIPVVPPVHLPVPIHLPAPQPVQLPPPIHLPAPQPVHLPAPIQQPAPQPVQLPWPFHQPSPVHQPAPVHQPSPVHVPSPQPVQMPEPQLPAPEAPGHMWAPGGPDASAPGAPGHMWAPGGPDASAPEAPGHMWAPGGPDATAPEAPGHMPAPEAPGGPAMPAPEAPVAPGMPAPDSPPAQGPFGPPGGDNNGPHSFGGGANGPATDTSSGPFGGNHGGGGFGGFGGPGFGGGFGGGPGGFGGPGFGGGFGGGGFGGGGFGGGGFGGGGHGGGGGGGHGR